MDTQYTNDLTPEMLVSSAGSLHAIEDRGIALVGSELDNGDVIISTPQASSVLVGHVGIAMPSDFLRPAEGA